MATVQEETCPFLRLPPEVRSVIYTFLLVEDRPILILIIHPEPVEDLDHEQTGLRIVDLPKRSLSGSVPAIRRVIWPPYPRQHELPPIASVSKLIREEVLPLYFSANKFTLGANEHQAGLVVDDSGHIIRANCNDRSGTVDRWRRHLGESAKDLRDITFVTRNFHPFRSGHCGKRGEIATRVSFREGGTMLFEQTAIAQRFCVCRFRRIVGNEAGAEKDGRRLLNMLEGWIEKLSFLYNEQRLERCTNCELDQLTYATGEWPSFSDLGTGRAITVETGVWEF